MTEHAHTHAAGHADAHGHGHGHDFPPGAYVPHTVSVKQLVAVIATLMVLTVVTVLAAKVELGSANVFVAMAIATVKVFLVTAFFMHLWWDKPINTLVLLFAVSLLALFLSFSILDTREYRHSVRPEFALQEMATRRAQLQSAPRAGGEQGHPSGQQDPPGKGPEAQPQQQGALPQEPPKPAGPSVAEIDDLRKWAKRNFAALPAQMDAKGNKNPITPEKVALGRQLYFDKRISKNHDLSCASCHDLQKYGVDVRPESGKFSAGHKGQMGTRNSPTVYNAALHTSQFWDGREPDTESQAKGPLINPVEMAMADHPGVVTVLKSIPGYVEAFKKAFPDEAEPITIDTYAKAVGAFERKLVTPGPIDRWLNGDNAALTPEQFAGLKVFKDVNCTQCHTGPAFGGTMIQKLGLVNAWEGHPDDGQNFKVPGLRNVTKTAPYLHDGTEPDLATVMKKMAKYQLGKELSDKELASLMALMDALTGELPPQDLIGAPDLPPSGPDTPKPDPN